MQPLFLGQLIAVRKYVMIRTHHPKPPLVTTLIIALIIATITGCNESNNTIRPELTDYSDIKDTPKNPLTLNPEPHTTVRPNQHIQIKFERKVTNVTVNGTRVKTWGDAPAGFEFNWEVPTEENTQLYLTITYSLLNKSGNKYEEIPVRAGPYIVKEKIDYTPPRIIHSSVLHNDRDGRPYPPWVKKIDGRTDIDPNTLIITVTLDKPGYDISITNESGERLWWRPETTTNTLTLTQRTPEYVEKFIDETSVTKQMWVGTPLDTPAAEVKGKFVEVKIPTVHGLEPSKPLEPNSTYNLHIGNHITITFKTGGTQ